MAVTTSTVDNINLSSSYKCYNLEQVVYYDDGEYSSVISQYTSSASQSTAQITFTYSNIGTEPINMAVLQMTSANNTYGGSLYVDDEGVYLSGGIYTVYLEPSVIGATTTSFTLKFITYTPTHYHHSNYDSRAYHASGSVGSYPAEQYLLTKNHTGVLNLENITLKIYTGDDFVSVPSTSALFVGVNDVAKKVTDIFVGVDGVARKVSDAWIGINGVARKFWPCLELKDVPPGSIIQLDETGTGTLVDYIVVAQNHYLNDINTEGHTVFMRKNLVDTTVKYGNNTYGEAYVGESLDTYINETWKASLDGRIIMKLMDITIPCNKWSSPYTSSAERQIWVPARDEIDPSYVKNEGPCFEYFIDKTTNADKIAYTANGTARAWWTRSCVEGMGSDGYVRVINTSGSPSNYKQSNSCYCRPVFCLPNSLPVSLISEGQYDLIL